MHARNAIASKKENGSTILGELIDTTPANFQVLIAGRSSRPTQPELTLRRSGRLGKNFYPSVIMSNMGSPGDISRSRTQSNMAAREGTRRSVRGQLERTPTQLPVAQALSRKESSTHGDKGHGKHPHKLGMFKGVLVPTCENMWGVIIFLRFYTIVGYAGTASRSSS